MSEIEARAVTFAYGRKMILNDVHVQIDGGSLTALVGANGSGKSTLLRLLFGAQSPREGVILLNDVSLSKLPAWEVARKIAFVAQENPAPFAFTVEELIRLGIAEGTAAGREKRLQDALARFDLLPLRGRSLLGLSGGERQRAHIARGWAQNTPFLLLDEPTAHLDITHQHLLLRRLREAVTEERRGIVVALHDLNLAAAYADRILLLHNGAILADGAPATVLTPENLQTAYGFAADVFSASDGKPLFIWPANS